MSVFFSSISGFVSILDAWQLLDDVTCIFVDDNMFKSWQVGISLLRSDPDGGVKEKTGSEKNSPADTEDQAELPTQASVIASIQRHGGMTCMCIRAWACCSQCVLPVR